MNLFIVRKNISEFLGPKVHLPFSALNSANFTFALIEKAIKTTISTVNFKEIVEKNIWKHRY